MRRICLYLLIGLISYVCSAENICIMLNQQNATQIENNDKPIAITETLETELMEVFFNLGYIVTNEPITIGSMNNSTNIDAYNAALLNSMKYFILVTLEFDVDIDNPTAKNLDYLKKIGYKIIKTRDNSILFESSQKSPEKIKGEPYKKGLKRLANNLVSDINLKIRQNR